MTTVADLRVKIFADGADLEGIRTMAAKPWVRGFTTNPTLMRKAGVDDYRAFAREVLRAVPDRPVSFEVFADDLDGMERQGRVIASWGPNVYVKIPVTTTGRRFTGAVINSLSVAGVRVNVTAVLTLDQVKAVTESLTGETPAVISVFAGRIADTGVDPMPIMRESLGLLKGQPKAELLWASVREVLNIFQADQSGCHIVTVPHDVLNKALKLAGTPLDAMSLDTVKMFNADAVAAGFSL